MPKLTGGFRESSVYPSWRHPTSAFPQTNWYGRCRALVGSRPNGSNHGLWSVVGVASRWCWRCEIEYAIGLQTFTFASEQTAVLRFLCADPPQRHRSRGHQEVTGGSTPNPFPESPPTMMNFYGNNLHVVAYPNSETHYSWALTECGPEAKETWRAMDQASQDGFKTGRFSELPAGVGGLICGAEKMIKYGLYDRPELEKWHDGRVLLIGDAAHPTSPHLGQGARQSTSADEPRRATEPLKTRPRAPKGDSQPRKHIRLHQQARLSVL
uniref:FAD-binding domain-containing protein n=1 Tax=Mycena chlorophos TaxID=658473 RepID=A0ABQ0L6S8_MYCCL|nr:predicted protein [Mycena chlorophos]